MARIRITGLVRLADRLRRDLAHPLSREWREQWRELVSSTMGDVQEILAGHGATLQDLPAPSQRAYQFLSGVAWEKVAVAESAEAAPAVAARLSYSGLSGFVERAMNHLAGAASQAERDGVYASIAGMSRRIEFDLEREGIRPDQLSAATLAFRGWLAFLTEGENFSIYVAALQTAMPFLGPAAQAIGCRHPVVIHFCPMSHLYRVRPHHFQTTVSLLTPMVAFGAGEFAVLAEAISRNSRHAKQRLHEAMMGEGYQAIHAELESLAGLVEQNRGAYHDLGAAFDRVNCRYFGGQMGRPRLTWSRAFTGRKFGHYDRIRDTVMISSTLDQNGVVPWVVDFVVYHELLHKHLGWRILDGRRYSHTSDFRALERRFERVAEAEATLQLLARNQLPAAGPDA
jgi:hypothetical protein